MLCTQKRRVDATSVLQQALLPAKKVSSFQIKSTYFQIKAVRPPLRLCLSYAVLNLSTSSFIVLKEQKTNVKTCLEVKPVTSSKNNNLISIYTIVCCFSPCLSDTNATCLPLTSTKPFREVDVLCRIQTEPNWI